MVGESWSKQMTTKHLKLTSVLQRTPSKQDSPTTETHIYIYNLHKRESSSNRQKLYSDPTRFGFCFHQGSCIAPSYPYITCLLVILIFPWYLGTYARALFIILIDVYI